jgi:hypothetical protein
VLQNLDIWEQQQTEIGYEMVRKNSETFLIGLENTSEQRLRCTEHPTKLYPQHSSCRNSFIAFEACTLQELKAWFSHVLQLILFHRKVPKCWRTASKKASHILKTFLDTYQSSSLKHQHFLFEKSSPIFPIKVDCPTDSLLHLILWKIVCRINWT